ncbi:MAG: GNAT family N-acetyltransferase [Anaerolineae bacterium]|nr:GNAT family N-acetyltransferase [Anaerolineae bacterium]
MVALDRTGLHVSLTIRFRLATEADLPKLEWHGQFAHFRPLFRKAFQEQKAGRRAMLIADCHDFPIGHIFVQFARSKATYTDDEERAYLYSLRVMEMFQGQGIGTRLIHMAEGLIQDRRMEWVTIAVGKQNIGALRLYERLGYDIYTDDPGRWSYRDHQGIVRHMNEPSWLLQKRLYLR